jgi:hypothetical protein
MLLRLLSSAASEEFEDDDLSENAGLLCELRRGPFFTSTGKSKELE